MRQIGIRRKIFAEKKGKILEVRQETGDAGRNLGDRDVIIEREPCPEPDFKDLNLKFILPYPNG
jgi:hypothetical protein